MTKEYAIQALIAFFEAAQEDGAVDDVIGDDDDALEWSQPSDGVTMTYGTMRQAAMAVGALKSKERV